MENTLADLKIIIFALEICQFHQILLGEDIGYSMLNPAVRRKFVNSYPSSIPAPKSKGRL